MLGDGFDAPLLQGRSTTSRTLLAACHRAASDGRPLLLVAERGVPVDPVARAIHGLAGARGRFVVCEGVQRVAGGRALAAGGTLLVTGIAAEDVRPLVAGGGEVRIILVLSPQDAERLDPGRPDGMQQPIRVPPLRERPDDVLLLAAAALRVASMTQGKSVSAVTPEARTLLRRYTWPGNDAEVEAVVGAAVAVETSNLLTSEALPLPRIPSASLSYREFLARGRDQLTREYLVGLLRVHEGSVTHAARHAGMERESLHRLLRRFGVHAGEYRR